MLKGYLRWRRHKLTSSCAEKARLGKRGSPKSGSKVVPGPIARIRSDPGLETPMLEVRREVATAKSSGIPKNLEKAFLEA